MRTAVLVLAILGDVFGGLGTLLALVFGVTLVGMSSGAAGQGAAVGAVLALLALVVGIIATALSNRRPRIAGGLLLMAAVLGTVGTLSFLLGSVLYLIAGVMAFFVRPMPGGTPGQTLPAPDVGTTSQPRGALPRPSVTRRTAIIATAVLVVVAILGSLAASQNAEQKPVKGIIAALTQGDDVALAALLHPALRSGTASRDADTVLSLALGSSELAYLNADWLRRLGPATGTTMAFENMSYMTTGPGANAAVVHLRGLFAPSNQNPLVNLALQVFRGPLDADVRVASVEGTWYVTGQAVPPSPSPTVSTTPRPSTPAPSTPAPSTPGPTTRPTVTLAPPVLFTADFNAPASLPTQVRGYSVIYQGGHALLNQCLGGLGRCVWGINRAGLVAIAATAKSQTGVSCAACGSWGVVLRAGPTNWVERGLADNATIAMIAPTIGEYQLIVVNNLTETVLAKGTCTCVNRIGPNTLEIGLDGAQLYVAINGVEVSRVTDTQANRGSGYGIFVGQNLNDATSLDVSYFAGR